MNSKFEEVMARIRNAQNNIEFAIIDIYQSTRRLEDEIHDLSKDEKITLRHKRAFCLSLLEKLNHNF